MGIKNGKSWLILRSIKPPIFLYFIPSSHISKFKKNGELSEYLTILRSYFSEKKFTVKWFWKLLYFYNFMPIIATIAIRSGLITTNFYLD